MSQYAVPHIKKKISLKNSGPDWKADLGSNNTKYANGGRHKLCFLDTFPLLLEMLENTKKSHTKRMSLKGSSPDSKADFS